MTGRTADSLVDALLLDIWPHAGAITDYGLNQQNYKAYQQAVRHGKINANQLHAIVGDGPRLSKVIGVPITTLWDAIPEEVE